MVQTRVPNGPKPQRAWWKEAAVYQIYPSSFKDSNGDGIGDIPGVIEKLDYIEALGVDIIWVTTIADYRSIDPRYGSMDDVDRLIHGLRRRNMKFLMDLVVNHTSDQHAWFQESRSSVSNPYRNWYIWRKPRIDDQGNRRPPNNWSTYFGGSAWTFDKHTGEYYLHLFAPEQPDLNWECDEMRAEVYDVMRFWLDKGVDGFRMDVINLISKDRRLPDATVVDNAKQYHHGSEHYANGPRIHEYLQDIGAIMQEYGAFSVGEMPWISDADEILRCVGSERNELNMIFNFDIVEGIDHGAGGKFSPKEWQMSELKDIVNKWQRFMYDNNGWNALFLENHDQARTVSRWASDKAQHREQASKMFATFLGLQSGTVFLYQGQELGMSNIPEHWEMEDFHDLETLNHWQELRDTEMDKESLVIAKGQYHLKSRDNARTPMQWSAGEHAGFTDGQPWFRVNDRYRECNASSQVGVAGSPFQYWAHILSLRKAWPDVFVYGDFELVDRKNEDVFAYTRRAEDDCALVVCNFRERTIDWSVPTGVFVLEKGDVLASVYPDVQSGNNNSVRLRPFEAFVVRQQIRHVSSSK
ncbi:glycoside hydrolase family 13 protein [Zasmidium cellare ATCC 36951]|uniref:Glycoside hydrolase family 13 protein n=1 Tax=Zasmidium cellare ATCC 36951 TaxID=1080233 RepID=A0A6A6CH42_ZASCE|nr:glycoside hydrolase family 13 protein [Zasmidium cellare ATCC 36951]KAF2166557.1 glycoside hydrolase family 13 protein [Zasmidium cellare ATCC 36951]